MKSIQKSVSSRIRFLLNVMIMSVVFPCLSYGAAYLTSISSNPPTVPSGGIATVTVRVSEACGAGGCTVGLYSQKPSLFPLPSSVTVPEGAASVSIAVQAAVNNTGSGQYFIIQANMNGNYMSYGVLLAKPVIGAVLSTFTNDSNGFVYSGQQLNVSLSLSENCTLVGGCAVKMSPNSSTLISFPASFIIPEGSSTGHFSVLVGSTVYATSASLSASFNGVTKYASMNVFPALSAPNADGSYNMKGFGSSTRTGTGSVTKSMNISMAFNNMKSHISSYVSKQCQAAIPGGILVAAGSAAGYGEFKNSNGLLQYNYTQNMKCTKQ